MCGVLALLFLVVPTIEIYVIIQVGGTLGAWPTLAIVASTAIIGASLVKRQGTAVLRRLQESMAEGQGAAKIIAESVLILVAGVTLLAPGFITDAIGIALLLPPIRSVIAAKMVSKVKRMPVANVMGATGFPPATHDEQDPPPPGVIDV